MKNIAGYTRKIFFLLLAVFVVWECNSSSNKEANRQTNRNAHRELLNDGWSNVTTKRFSISYPNGWEVKTNNFAESWSSLSTEVEGQILTVIQSPKQYLSGTNFGRLKVTVAQSSKNQALKNCLKPAVDQSHVDAEKVTIHGIHFTVIRTTEAATGDRYVIQSYRRIRRHTCWVVESVVHSSPIGFYGEDSGVAEFDEKKVEAIVQKMIHSFQFKKTLRH